MVGYRPNQAALNQMLNGRTGPVVLHIANVGRQAEGNARRLVGVKSGALKASIGSRIVKSNQGYNVEIFAGGTPKTQGYVLAHHSGARPHVIRRSDGKTVNHPGNKGTFFLLRGAQQAGLQVRRR